VRTINRYLPASSKLPYPLGPISGNRAWDLQEKIKSIISDLDANSFRAREKASVALKAMLPDAIIEVRKYYASPPNLEGARRASQIIREFEKAVYNFPPADFSLVIGDIVAKERFFLLKDMTGRVFWDKFPPKLPIWAADYKNVNDPMKK
jgi:hypothetical protein